MNWQPTAEIQQLQLRARVNATIRQFFAEREVLEVETPLLGEYTVTEPNIESYFITHNSADSYLQTSPEYFMKRLLAAGVGDIYALTKAFRVDESGRYHNREFTLLEWYRQGFDDRRLAQELVDLIGTLAPDETAVFSTYAELFESSCGINPHRASVTELRQLAQERLAIDWPDTNKSLWLDLLFSHLVEPSFAQRLQVVLDYPACQGALARITESQGGVAVARRFEVYWKGIELANGYWELTDASEQRQRFNEDNRVRRQLGRKTLVADEQLLAALSAGMPACAGVALGVDRLLMCLANATSIEQVLAFR